MPLSNEKMETLVSYAGKDRLVSWQEYLSEKEKNKTADIKVLTGFPELDFYLDGLVTGELIVLSGLTGNGKTLFLKSLLRNFASDKIPVTVLSYEVTTDEFIRPFKEENFGPIFYVPKELRTGYIPWVEERVIEGRLKYDNRILLLDHLHYVVDMKTDKMFQNIGAAMRCLKEIAIKHKQIIFIVAHQEKLKDDKEPGIETLRDSSFVGQEADVVLIVHRLPDSTDKKIESSYDLGFTLIKIDKARRSGAYKKRLSFVKKGNWLVSI